MPGGESDKPKTTEEPQDPSAEGGESLVFNWVPVEDKPAEAPVVDPTMEPSPVIDHEWVTVPPDGSTVEV